MSNKKEDFIKEKYIENSVNPVSIEGLEKILFQMKNCICKIYKNDGTKGTGFFCRIPFPDESNLLHALFTNNHVLDQTDLENNKIIEISINNEKEERNIKIDNKRRIFTNPQLDITIIEINPYKDKLNSNNFLEIDENINMETSLLNKIYKKQSIYALHYPKGKNIVSSYGLISNLMDNDLYHNCNTEYGSSGCPILLVDTFKVVGIHYGGGHLKYNKGTFIKYAINAFNNKYKNNFLNNISKKPKSKNKEVLNEINLIYTTGDYEYIRIFSKKFVENNKENCKIIINGKELEICEYIDRTKMIINNNILKVKLKEIKPIINMSYMFFECRRLISLPDISEWDFKNVIDIGYMFDSCLMLRSLPDISNWKTNNIVNMRALFEYCVSLPSLPDISKWKTNNVTDMSFMFNRCRDLINIPDISNWNLDNVTNIEAMFNRCSSLKSLPDISNWNIYKVTNLRGLFGGCSSLTYLPDISNWITNNVIDISSLFDKCNSLISLPDISKWATRNVIYMYNLFELCTSLVSLPDISKWNTENVIDMKFMFFKCSSLTSLPDISKWNTENVTDMKSMFNQCSLLTSLPEISKWNINNVTNMDFMFYECSSLEKLPNISKWNIDHVIDKDYMFYHCKKSLKVPKKFL